MRKELRTYKDRSEYMKAAVARRRRKIKELAIEYKGGKCYVCGYDRYIGALEFHHIDPTKKEFGLGMSGLTRSWEKTRKELDKCVIICSNCHRELHGGLIELEKFNNPR